MNNRQRKNGSMPIRTMAALIFAAFSHTVIAIDSTAQADGAAPSKTECLLNWAQTFHPEQFSPPVSGEQLFAYYTYRYYPGTQSLLAVSSTDNHVYYKGTNDSVPRDVGNLSAWLKEAGCGPVPFPVIFVHGIASSADTWAPLRDYLINNAGWVFGGVPSYNPSTKSVAIGCPSNPSQPVSCSGKEGNFYTLNFSDNQNLPFDVQGSELSAIIRTVLAANPGKTKVILVSHSMGSLAAREYVQGLARQPDAATPIPYRNDVAKLITVGAPHQGSFWAEECYHHFDILDITGNVGICGLLSLDIDPNSIALNDLQPDSTALSIVNDVVTHPLPTDISYVSIIGTGQQTISDLTDFEAGDGIVSEYSQDLANVTVNQPLQHKSVKVNVQFRECGNRIDVPLFGDIGEIHTCEPSDPGVEAEILKDVQDAL